VRAELRKRLRPAKPRNSRHAVLADDDVKRIQFAMSHRGRCTVRRRQTFEHLAANPQSDPRGKAVGLRLSNQRRERFSGKLLASDKHLALGLPALRNRHEIRMRREFSSRRVTQKRIDGIGLFGHVAV